MELSFPMIKKFLFLKRKLFLYSRKELFKLKKKKKNNSKKFLKLREMELSSPTLKDFWYFWRNLQTLKIKCFLYFFLHFLFVGRELFKHKHKGKKFFIPFFIQFSKLKYFFIIIIKRFFSFYNIFLYAPPVYFFHLLKDFCNVHNLIVAFFLFLC